MQYLGDPASVSMTLNASRLNGQSAAALLQVMAEQGRGKSKLKCTAKEEMEALGREPFEAVSRKDKSLGLLCDNFLQLFAAGYSDEVELEAVAAQLSVGRRRIYDIVNVLESLGVVQKGKSSRYKWLGISTLPSRISALEKEWIGAEAVPAVKLLHDTPRPSAHTEENAHAEGGGSLAAGVEGAAGAAGAGAEATDTDRDERGRKEKSIGELSIKFIGLLLQAAVATQLDGVLSLEQAARSLLVLELHGKEPNCGAMKTKVRRLYDICNVLDSMGMLDKVKIPGTSKPAFKWLGVTQATQAVFDAEAARRRSVKQYGGGASRRDMKAILRTPPWIGCQAFGVSHR
uniref:E2F/DP family winged-helix DNA-binding domain-containing protein n=1 Tax=Calcidiscus leptoporus TaxID=127549 RepID=A0A7S0JAE0_9EUKA|mmetsp:Transcript_47221/g.109573  ORF Transcript_47221/g.109573 Transcript_47221/m.109573 type:complete len:345 (+) Transcript_47221:58-1092(+)